MATRVMADFRGQLRYNKPVTIVRVKMSFTERMSYMVRKNALIYGIAVILCICLLARMVANWLASGKLANALAVGFASLALIGFAALLLWADNKTK